jgi:hypothetical protein
MKKSILLILTIAFSSYLMAQMPSLTPQESFDKGGIFTPFVSPKGAETRNMKRQVTEWYNFIEASRINGGIAYQSFSNNTLFPDSTVQQLYGVAGGGSELGPVNRHNAGQVFDPTSFYFDEPLSIYNSYQVDSVEIAYRYAHNIPGTVDTLEIQFFWGSSVSLGRLLDNNMNELEKTAWIGYNRTFGIGANANATTRITLSQDDTSWANYNTIGVRLPTIANIAAGGAMAVAFRFIPGYAYEMNDTIQHDWDPEPTKKLNHFMPLISRDNAKTADDSYNNSLAIYRWQKYALPNTNTSWHTVFFTGDAALDYVEHTWVSFHVTSNNVSVNSLESLGLSVGDVYPNPSAGNNEIKLGYTLEKASEVSFDIYDVVGNKVKSVLSENVAEGSYTLSTDISGLQKGIYFLSVNAGGVKTTRKFTVTQ